MIGPWLSRHTHEIGFLNYTSSDISLPLLTVSIEGIHDSKKDADSAVYTYTILHTYTLELGRSTIYIVLPIIDTMQTTL